MSDIVQFPNPHSQLPGGRRRGSAGLDTVPPVSAAESGRNESRRWVGLFRRLEGFKTRKRLVVFGLLPAGFGLGYLFYLGCVAGFAICKVCGGAESGLQGRVRSIIIPLRTHELHLHHWLLSAVATVTSAIQGFSLIAPGLFYGVLGGLILQGILCYDDWHRIIKRRAFCAPLEAVDQSPF